MGKKRGRPQLSRTNIEGQGHLKSSNAYFAQVDFKRSKKKSKKSTKTKGDSQGWTSEDLKKVLHRIADSPDRHIPRIYAQASSEHPPKKKYVSEKAVRGNWKKIVEACQNAGLDPTAANLKEFIDGVSKFGGTGEQHRHFSDDTEKFFVDLLWSMRDIGLVVNDSALLDLANYYKHLDDKGRGAPLTIDWVKSFRKRHKDVKKVKVGGMDKQRIRAASMERIEAYNTLKLAFYARLKREGKIKGDFPLARQILNMDEMAEEAISKWGKMYAVDDKDDPYNDRRQLFAKHGDKQEPFHVTLAMTTCADGSYFVDPFIIHSGSSNTDDSKQTISREIASNLPKGSTVTVSGSGSMTRVLFSHYAQHLVRSVNKVRAQSSTGVKETMVLFFDGHTSRMNPAALRYLKDNNIECFCLPSHASAWAQPNDVGPNKSLKAHLKRANERHLRGNYLSPTLRRDEYNAIFTEGWEAFLKEEEQNRKARKGANGKAGNIAIRAFKKSGIFPHNAKPPLWVEAAQTIGQQNEIRKGKQQQESTAGSGSGVSPPPPQHSNVEPRPSTDNEYIRKLEMENEVRQMNVTITLQRAPLTPPSTETQSRHFNPYQG